jgi:hypothetical protein
MVSFAMGNPIQRIEANDSNCPAALRKDDIPSNFPTFWAIGNLDILNTKLLGIFYIRKKPIGSSWSEND